MSNKTPKPSDKQDDVSDEDRDLFRSTVGPVKRIKNDRIEPLRPPQRKSASINRQTDDKLFDYAPGMFETGIAPDETLYFSRGGVQKNILQGLRTGRITPEQSFDLHGLKREHAIVALNHFIDRAVAHGNRFVCIVHGKGYGASNGLSVIKGMVNEELKRRPEVLAFLSAPAQNGGTGAVMVVLKRR